MFSKYQNIEIPGEELSVDNPKRKNSAYWNEGKWNNFVLPLLPKDPTDMTFVEIGCNAGLFLRMAKEYGFRNVYGYEKDGEACNRGTRYRDALGLNYKIINKAVGENLDLDELPMADVVLLSNVHYYFDLDDWLKLIDKLRWKTRYVIVISRPVDPRLAWWRPLADIGNVRLYFKEWDEVKTIYTIRVKHDPHRRELWSFLFESKLRRIPFSEFRYSKQGKMIGQQRIEFIRQVLRHDHLDVKETEYYKAIVERMKHQWNETKAYEFVKGKMEALYDLKNNGIRDPVILQLDNHLLDGGHRCDLLKEMGYKSVIVRKV